MSFVHTSVNEESQLYLANERRYNYTTPKSFLEQVCSRQKYFFSSPKLRTSKAKVQVIYWSSWTCNEIRFYHMFRKTLEI